jgi:hypothetical protein
MDQPSKEVRELCFNCGRSVKRGSGWFVNRVPSLDTREERETAQVLYPDGDFLCGDCDRQEDDAGD